MIPMQYGYLYIEFSKATCFGNNKNCVKELIMVFFTFYENNY